MPALSVTRRASCQNMPYTDKNAGSIGSRYAVRRSAPSTTKTLETVSHKNG